MSDPLELTPERLRAMPLPAPEEGGDKDARGRVLVVGGSARVPGAAVLAAESALRAGAGKLQVATVRSVAAGMALALPEALVIACDETAEGEIAASASGELRRFAQRSDALLVGPGMVEEGACAALAGALLSEPPDCPVVLDAGALCGLPALPRAKSGAASGRWIITPHAGEMAGLLDRPKEDVEADPLGAAREASARFGCVVVMKGRRTFIVGPDGQAFRNEGGHVGLATSGSGDTLGGLITGLAARGAHPIQAAAWGVFVHASAGTELGRRYGGVGYLARELPPVFASVLGKLSD